MITKGIKMREPWRKLMKQITKDLSNLIAMVNNNNIPCTDVDINKINTLQDLLPTVIASIEEADRGQGLFSDQPTNQPLTPKDAKLLW